MGLKKFFLNMTSKNGSKELISLLQYMKETDINNPEILVRDERIIELDKIVTEVKCSEEWEKTRMTIYGMGLERGIEQGIRAFILDKLEDGQPKEKIIARLKKHSELEEQQALEFYDIVIGENGDE